MSSPKPKLWPFYQQVLLQFSVFPVETKKKQTAVNPECIDQLP